MFAVVWHKHSQGEDTDDVEKGDSEECHLMALGMTIPGLAASPTVTPMTWVPPKAHTVDKDTSRGIDQRTSKLSLR